MALEARPITPIPLPADIHEDVTLRWSMPLGEGGALVPRLADPAARQASDVTFTRLVGVHFCADRDEILFVGVTEPGHQPLDPDELLDAFVVAYRAAAQGDAPRMSIDPTPQQLAGGLGLGTAMNVVYFGGLAGTEFGQICFEADRQMKCLSLGADNLTGMSFACGMPGYRSELDLLVASPQGRQSSWHRFWFKQSANRMSQSSDGRTFLVDTRLGVETEYMVARNGRLEPGGQPPDPAARQFSEHLTEHFGAYALCLPVMNKLLAYASLTSVAEAVRTANVGAPAPPQPRPALSELWLLEEHEVAPAQTARTTPAIVATRQFEVSSTVSGVAQLTGGVDLRPRNTDARQGDLADALQRSLLAARPRPESRAWPVEFRGTTHRVVSARARRRLALWQQDLQVGRMALVRQYRPTGGAGEFGKGWSLRMPRLMLSEEVATYEGFGEAPRWICVWDQSGRQVRLSRFGQMSLPGQPETFGYVSADGEQRVACYKNRWLYLGGKVDFVSYNDGPPVMQLQAETQVIQFSPDAAHFALSVRTADAVVQFTYEEGRLASVADAQGHSVRLRCDNRGRCSRLEASDGNHVGYRYDPSGYMKSVFLNDKHVLSYIYNKQGTPVGIRGDMSVASAPAHQAAAQFAIYDTKATASTSRSVPEVVTERVAHIQIEAVPDDRLMYQFVVDGKTRPVESRLQPLLGDALTTNDQGAMKTLRDGLHLDELLAGRDAVVVSGERDLACDLAAVLRRLAPDVSVFTASDPRLADRNLQSPAPACQPSHLMVFGDTLEPAVARQLQELRDGPEDADTLMVIGHNCPAFIGKLHAAGNSGRFQNKNLILVTCGSEQMPGLVENCLKRFDAISVVGFEEPINQRLLPPLVKGLQMRLQAGRGKSTAQEAECRKDWNLHQIFRETIEETLRDFKAKGRNNGIDEKDIDTLRMWFEQMGALHRTGAPAEQPQLGASHRSARGLMAASSAERQASTSCSRKMLNAALNVTDGRYVSKRKCPSRQCA